MSKDEQAVFDLLTNMKSYKLKELEASIQDLRVVISYLLFENEALKREYQSLLEMIQKDL
jgi:regulator of replication initiation timing